MKQPVPSHLGWSHRTTAASHAHSNSQAMSFDYAGKRMSMGWGAGARGRPITSGESPDSHQKRIRMTSSGTISRFGNRRSALGATSCVNFPLTGDKPGNTLAQ